MQRLTPGIERQLRAGLARHYAYARRAAVIQMQDTDPAFEECLPRECPYAYEPIVGEWLLMSHTLSI